jgi:hypothetical protein
MRRLVGRILSALAVKLLGAEYVDREAQVRAINLAIAEETS